MNADRDDLAQQVALARALTKSQRFERALALTSLVRRLARAGAIRRAGAQGSRAVNQRFLRQLHGPELTPELRLLVERL